MSVRGYGFLLPVALLCYIVNGDDSATCREQVNCSSCLSANPNCAWCKAEEYGYERCSGRTVAARLCPLDDIVFPEASFNILKEQPLSDKTGRKQPVQISPQHVQLRLRPHQPYTVEVQFRQAEDYPLDLYYLMDLTYTQWDDKDILVTLGNDMAVTLRGLTANYRVGFGSFVDKPVMPYVSQVPDYQANPCALYQRRCVPAYGFRNHLNLTDDITRFTGEVRAAGVSANIDDPEGGIDAIVQAASCGNHIGWTPKSRKLIIYTSNGLFHLAGEGLLGGAVRRNDLQCHLDQKGYYTLTTDQDYPSVEEMDKLLRQQSINLVFAVTKKNMAEYEKLAKIMRARVQVEELLEDSSNILSVIRRQYETITSRIELQDDAGDDIRVRYSSRCLDGALQDRNNCTGIRKGDNVTFLIQVEALRCPLKKRQTITLKDVGTSETVLIEVEVLCTCECERPEMLRKNSDRCSGIGDLQCGVCACPPNSAGRACECQSSERNAELESRCQDPRRTSQPSPLCSGRGDCVCGKCECHTSPDPARRISGAYCECDNFACNRARDGTICGGEDRGYCDCGECVCLPGWTGRDCSCSNDTRTCTPHTGLVDQLCSGKGDCKCGSCHCYRTEQGRYAGLYCEDCPTCKGLCTTYKPCVQCQFGRGLYSPEDCREKCPYLINLKEKLGGPERGTVCRFTNEDDGCSVSFQYYSEPGQAIIDVLKKRECPEDHTLTIALSTVLSVVFVGLLTLAVWRLYTYLHDRREYARFQLELRTAVDTNLANTNQLYQSPVTKYLVPSEVTSALHEDD